MYWILFVMGAIVAVIVALLVGGLATPRTHVASRTMLLRAPIDEVWRVVRDVGAYADWRPEVQSSLVDGDEWQESTGRQAMRFGITASEEPVRFAARILDDDLPFSGDWEWRLQSQDGGTRIVLTENGSVGNPIFRFLGAHVFGYTRTIDAYLVALAARVGDAAARIDDTMPSAEGA